MDKTHDEFWYFSPEADTSKITVPELRSILLKHGVTYPSSAKKPILVGLFNDQVLPQAAMLQRTQARTKRSTRGIVDMPSSASTTTTDDTGETEDESLLAPPPTVTKRTSRRTMHASTEEEPETVAPAPRRSKTPVRAVPAKHTRGSDVEADERPAVRRNRKSAVTPAAKQILAPDDDSPFTQENPFQKGSSPTGPDPGARERRRRTMGSEQKEKRKSDVFRRRTVQPNAEQLDEGIVVPSRGTFDVSSRRLPKKEEEHHVEADNYDAGEEFTPEAQLEMVRDRAKAGEVDILPPRRRRQRSKATSIKGFSLTLLATVLTAFGGVWTQEKFAVGYCGIGKESNSLAGVDVPEWANALIPQCEPCPPHATCYQKLELICDRDFVKQDHPLSLGGLIPLPPTCEPDSEKTRRITLVADRGVQILRQRKAEFECGEPDGEGRLVETPEVREVELKQELATMKRKGMSQEEFDDLWHSAIGEMVRREEIVENTDGINGGRRLSSTSLAELSLSCSIRRSLRQTVERYIWQLILIVAFFTSGTYGRYRMISGRATEARAKQLAASVFDRLANHAALNAQDSGAFPEPGISMTQLRDDVLRTEFSSSKRQQLWEKVQKKVELNSNVRAAVRESRSGDVGRMWEWVGPIQHLIEDGRTGGRRRESGRYSLGGAIDSSPPESASREMKQFKGTDWPDSRPIY